MSCEGRAGSGPHPSVRTLAWALVWRSWRAHRFSLVALPAACGCLVIALSMVSFFMPGVLTGATRNALEAMADARFGAHGSAQVALSFVLFQGPFLLAIFAGIAGANVAHQGIAVERARGGFEQLLCVPYRIAQVFLALMSAFFILSALGWAVLASSLIGSVGMLMILTGLVPKITAGYAVGVSLVPLSLAFLACVVATWLSLQFPGLARLRVGTSVNIIQLIGTMPALTVFLFINANPTANLMSIIAGLLTFGCLVTAVGTATMSKWFRAEYMFDG